MADCGDGLSYTRPLYVIQGVNYNLIVKEEFRTAGFFRISEFLIRRKAENLNSDSKCEIEGTRI